MHLLTLLSFAVFVSGTFAQAIKYHCHRQDGCKNGGTCQTDGTCQCVGDYTGYNCDYLAAEVANCPVADQNKCLNGGVCHSATSLCSCAYGFSGDTCEIDLFDVTCTGDEIRIKFSFPTPFEGSISLQNQIAVGTACTFGPGTTVNNFDEYEMTIKIGEPTDDAANICGEEQITNVTDPATAESSYFIRLLVQYKEGVYMSLDELWNMTCIHTGANITLYKEVTDLTIDMPNDLTQQTKKDKYSPVVFNVLDMADVDITGPVSVSTEFQIHISLQDSVVYKNILIDSCTANNTLDPQTGDLKEYKFFDAGCPTEKGGRVAVQQVEKANLNDVTAAGKMIKMKAFRFVDSEKVGFMCTAKVCKDASDTKCANPTCDDLAADNGNRRRRKRNADDDSEKTVSTIITVIDPRDYDSQMNRGDQSTVEECLSRSEILAALIVIGVVMAILFIACFVLTCLMMRRKSNRNKFEPSSSTKSERFHIPRAHVNQSFRDI